MIPFSTFLHPQLKWHTNPILCTKSIKSLYLRKCSISRMDHYYWRGLSTEKIVSKKWAHEISQALWRNSIYRKIEILWLLSIVVESICSWCSVSCTFIYHIMWTKCSMVTAGGYWIAMTSIGAILCEDVTTWQQLHIWVLWFSSLLRGKRRLKYSQKVKNVGRIATWVALQNFIKENIVFLCKCCRDRLRIIVGFSWPQTNGKIHLLFSSPNSRFYSAYFRRVGHFSFIFLELA